MIWSILQLIASVVTNVIATERAMGSGKAEEKKDFAMELSVNEVGTLAPAMGLKGGDPGELVAILKELIDVIVALLNYFGILKHISKE